MDEYEKLEEDLQKLYEDYMLKFRNQAFLEQALEEYNRQEHDKTEVRISSQIIEILNLRLCPDNWTIRITDVWINKVVLCCVGICYFSGKLEETVGANSTCIKVVDRWNCCH